MAQIPDRAFDVGIAEQHAVTLSAGMAAEGLIPFCNIYSTFLQRAYDQVIHDVALQDLPVVFCLDRAGIVGQDGATHHGVFDLAYLRCIPNLVIFAPMNEMELRDIMYTAQEGLPHPIAIRYPRGRGINKEWRSPMKTIPIGSSQELRKGSRIAVLSVGHIGNVISELYIELEQPEALGHYDMRFIKPLDQERLHRIFSEYEYIITAEDGCKIGGFGSAILEFASTHEYKQTVEILGIDDGFVEHGLIPELHKIAGIDPESIKTRIEKVLHEVY